MGTVGGLDIQRQQITFDYVDTVTGEVERDDRRRIGIGHGPGLLGRG